jgi:alpha-glucoside transport system permease protein
MVSPTPLHIALLAIGVVWLVPTVGLAITSFRTSDDINSSGWWHAFGQWHWTLHNYGAVIHAQNIHMGRAWLNSLIITIPATLPPLTIGALAAYGFAWVPFPFRDTIFLLVVADDRADPNVARPAPQALPRLRPLDFFALQRYFVQGLLAGSVKT